MAKVVIYTKESCPYCVRAKQLLQGKNVAYEEHNLENKPDELEALKARTKMRTVPQIFINDQLIGGFTELLNLQTSGKLDTLLA